MKAAEEMTREELIAYDKWLTRRKWGTGEIISPEKAADLYLAEHPLPPAEGATAEEFLKGCEHDGSFIPVHEVIRLMNAFAASQKQQPTAEGAEERLKNAPKNCPKAAQCAHVEGGMKCPPNVICPI